jgi:hypothetical protein
MVHISFMGLFLNCCELLLTEWKDVLKKLVPENNGK